MKPHPTAAPAASSNWLSSHSGFPYPPPISPSPPAADTAAARRPPAAHAIGARTTGCSSSKRSVRRVGNAISRSYVRDDKNFACERTPRRAVDQRSPGVAEQDITPGEEDLRAARPEAGGGELAPEELDATDVRLAPRTRVNSTRSSRAERGAAWRGGEPLDPHELLDGDACERGGSFPVPKLSRTRPSPGVRQCLSRARAVPSTERGQSPQ